MSFWKDDDNAEQYTIAECTNVCGFPGLAFECNRYHTRHYQFLLDGLDLYCSLLGCPKSNLKIHQNQSKCTQEYYPCSIIGIKGCSEAPEKNHNNIFFDFLRRFRVCFGYMIFFFSVKRRFRGFIETRVVHAQFQSGPQKVTWDHMFKFCTSNFHTVSKFVLSSCDKISLSA